MMQRTNTLKRLCATLDVDGKEKCGKTCYFFKEKQQQELYHRENSFFLSPPFATSILL
jgi:hypothetical protein